MADSTRIVADFTQVLNSLDQVDARLAGTSQGFAKVGESAKKAGNDVSKAFKLGTAQGVADALDNLQKEFDDLKKSADTLKVALKGATDPTAIKLYASSIAQLELGMADLEKVGRASGVNLRENNKQAGLGKQVFNEFFGAFTKAFLIAEAIRLIGEFVISAVNLASETAKATRQFEGFLGSTEAAAGAVADLTALASKKLLNTQDVLDAGKGLLAFGENVDNLVPALDRIADISAATGKNFNELSTIYGKARTSGVLYAEDINQLVDAGIPIIQEFAKQMGVSADQVKKLASEGAISFEELQLAFFNLTKEGAKFADAAEKQANELSGLWAALVSEARPAVQAIGDFFKMSAEGLLSVAIVAIRGIKELFGATDEAKVNIEVDYTGRDKYEQAKDDLFEQERLEKAAAKRRAELRAKSNADFAKQEAENEKKRASLRVQVIADETQREVAAENLRFSTIQAELKKLFKGRAELAGLLEQSERQHQQNLAKIYLDEVESFRDAMDKYDKEQADRLKEAENNQKERERILKEGAEGERDIRNAAIDIGAERAEAFLLRLKAQGANEAEIKKAQAEFDLEIQAARLRSEIEFQQALLAITDAGDKTAISKIEANINLLKSKLENIDFQIDNPDEKKKSSLFSLLGLDPNSPEFEKDKKALEQAVQETVAGFQAIAQARTDAADAAVEAANRELETANEQTEKARANLEEELSLQQQGFASDVDTAQKELANAEQAENKKKEIRDAALKDQQRAQKQQLIMDSLSQASSIAVAVSNLIKTWAQLPFGVGLIAAFAQAASIIAFMAKIRAQSKAISSQKFRHGGSGFIDDTGFVHGKTHEQGGNRLEIEKGEVFQVGDDGGKKRVSVVKRERVRDYFDLLDAANRNDKRAMARHALRLAGKEAAERGDNSKKTRTDTVTNSAINTAISSRESSETNRRESSEIYVRLVDAVERGDVREIEKRMSEIRVSETVRREIATAVARQDIHSITEKILKEHSVLEAYRTLTESAQTRNVSAIVRGAIALSGAGGVTNVKNQYLREAARFVTEKVLISEGTGFVQKEFSGDQKTAFARETIERVKSDFAATVERAKEVVGRANFERIIFAPPANELKFATPHNQISINVQEVARRVFGNGKIDSELQPQGGNDEAKRTNQLLEKMLSVMMQGQRQERWSADGKTKTKGNITTRYLN